MDNKKKAQQFFEDHDIFAYKDITEESELYAKDALEDDQLTESVDDFLKASSREAVLDKINEQVDVNHSIEAQVVPQTQVVKPQILQQPVLEVQANANSNMQGNVQVSQSINVNKDVKAQASDHQTQRNYDVMDERVYKHIEGLLKKATENNVKSEDEFYEMWKSKKFHDELEMLKSEAFFASQNELRKMGLPYDDSLDTDRKFNFYGKFLSAMAMISGALMEKTTLLSDIMAGNIGFSHALSMAGFVCFAALTAFSKKKELKYRLALARLADSYEESNGLISKEDIIAITGADQNIYPDEYKLAVMTQEEKDELFKNMPKTKPMSKRKQIKAIKKLLNVYEADQLLNSMKEDKNL